jgi:hypothetical protein
MSTVQYKYDITYTVLLSDTLVVGDHGVKKRCRLPWLTNSTLVYEPKCGGWGSRGVSANEYRSAHGAQINFADLTPYLTYGRK